MGNDRLTHVFSFKTIAAAQPTQIALNKSQRAASDSMTRLSTGYRVNSAMDDAAGLQIATRLAAQVSGMTSAQQNTQRATSMLQTAEGALGEINDVMMRMKDLATQAFDGSASADDKNALQSEYDALGRQIKTIVDNTSFGGLSLFNQTVVAGKKNGLFAQGAVTFQIGADSVDKMDFDMSSDLANLTADGTGFGWMSYSYRSTSLDTDTGLEFSTLTNALLTTIQTNIDDVSKLRSSIGATVNRLGHVASNLTNMVTNGTASRSRIMDTDYASETATMTTQQMLEQAGTSMLKNSKTLAQLAISLVGN